MDKAPINVDLGDILLVDDTPENLKVLRQVLEPRGYNILIALCGETALEIARSARPDLILLDVRMPGLDGYETCLRLKQNKETEQIPVIFITAENLTEGIVAGFCAGGVDYICKPFQEEEVLARVQTHLQVNRLTRELVAKNARIEEHTRELEATHEKLEATQAQLIAELERELQTAHDLQMGLMPQEPPRAEGFDIAGRCFPANHVGGDFFQYFQRDGKLAFSIADVTGHAMEAAIPVVMFSGILDTQMEAGDPLEDLFAKLNRSLYRNLDCRTFVCFAMGELDPVTSILRLGNGGCPFPYHFRASTGTVEEIQVMAYPLGARPNTSYPVNEVQVEPGDCIVFGSDGIIEAASSAGGAFGFERTREGIRQGCEEDLSAAALLERLVEEVRSFTGDTPPADDRTIVVVKNTRSK